MNCKIEIMKLRTLFLLFILPLTIFLQSCSGTEAVEETDSYSEGNTSEELTPTSPQATEILESPAITDPDQFLPYIQEAIRLDTLELMKELCHPDQSRIRYGNAFTVCGIRTANMDDIDKFRRWFGPAKLSGDIRLDADTAFLPTVLGDDERHPTVVLEKLEDRWYLVGMEWIQ